MISNNPLLKSAESDIDATKEQYQAAKSTFYPQVNVEMNLTMDKNVDGVRGHNGEWQAMVRLRYNLYQGGSDSADLQSKAYKIKEAQDIKDNALRTLNEEMRLAWSAMNNARQQLPIATDYSTRSARVRTAYQQQFSLGERTLLDLLDSENERFTSQRREVELRYLLMYSEYRVKARMGVLLKTMKITPPEAAITASSGGKSPELPSLN
ncbi:MAG: hypothetical protein XXXJIFNMEKO3_03360 [Candidatus Erwinia impunctatus]|nr:hypothetical protein XXXJIFNMEKO_03360 [Culicoides impunctatus]